MGQLAVVGAVSIRGADSCGRLVDWLAVAGDVAAERAPGGLRAGGDRDVG